MVVGKEKPHFEFLMTRPARTARTAVMYSRKDFIIRRYVFQTRIMAT